MVSRVVARQLLEHLERRGETRFLAKSTTERSGLMKQGKRAAPILQHSEEIDYSEITDRGPHEERLILKKEPPARREQLMAHGVKDIRCICCMRVRPIAGSAESAEGWICEDCISEMMEKPRFGGQRAR